MSESTMTTMTTTMMNHPTIMILALAILQILATLQMRALEGVTIPLATLQIRALADAPINLPVIVKSRATAVVKNRALAIVKRAAVRIRQLGIARTAPAAGDEQQLTAPGTLSSFQQHTLPRITILGSHTIISCTGGMQQPTG
jgi:hypothetical protein